MISTSASEAAERFVFAAQTQTRSRFRERGAEGGGRLAGRNARICWSGVLSSPNLTFLTFALNCAQSRAASKLPQLQTGSIQPFRNRLVKSDCLSIFHSKLFSSNKKRLFPDLPHLLFFRATTSRTNVCAAAFRPPQK